MLKSQGSMNTFKDPLSNIYNEDINEIIRGEISAIESYGQIGESVTDKDEVKKVREFHLEHIKSVDYWKSEVKSNYQIPEKSSGIWGVTVEGLVGTSKIFGDKAVLMTIKKGEEHGLDIYRKMLKSDKLTPLQKSEIRKTFIPRQEKHIESLKFLIEVK